MARTVSGAEFMFSTPNVSTAPLKRNGTATFSTLEPIRRLIEIITLKGKLNSIGIINLKNQPKLALTSFW